MTATIAALKAAGKLKAESDDARIVAALTLAEVVDTVGRANSQMWHEYRAAEADLHDTRDGASDDERDVIARLSAPIRDAKDTRAPHTRKPGVRRG
jgi:hypothetical protein